MKVKSFGINLFYYFLIGISIVACSNHKNPDKIAEKENEAKFKGLAELDAKAVADAYERSLFEMNLSYAVKGKAASEEVKLLADSMTMAHLEIDNQLKALAGKKNISLTAGLTEDQQKVINEMKDEDPVKLNMTYLDRMINTHKEAVKHYKKFAEESNDTDIKTWFENTLPLLEQHLDMSKRYKDAIAKHK